MKPKPLITGFRVVVALIAAALLFVALEDPDGQLKVKFVGVETNAIGQLEYYFWFQNNAFEGMINAELRTLINKDHLRNRYSLMGRKLPKGEAIIVPFVAATDGPWHVRFTCYRGPPASGLAYWLNRLNRSLPFDIFKQDWAVTVDSQQFDPSANATDNLPRFEAQKYSARIGRTETQEERRRRTGKVEVQW